MDLVRLGQDGEKGRAVLNKVMNIRIPYQGRGGGDFSTSLGDFSFSIRTLLHGVSYKII